MLKSSIASIPNPYLSYLDWNMTNFGEKYNIFDYRKPKLKQTSNKNRKIILAYFLGEYYEKYWS